MNNKNYPRSKIAINTSKWSLFTEFKRCRAFAEISIFCFSVRYDEELVIPIIENTPEERDLQVS